MSTQARTAGLGSFIGLDFSSLQVVLECCEVPRREWRYALEVLIEISNMAAKYWNSSNKDD